MLSHTSLPTFALLLVGTLFTGRAHAQEDDIPVPDTAYEQPQLEPPTDQLNDAPPYRDPAPVQAADRPSEAPASEARPSKLFSGGGIALLGSIGPSSEIALGFHAGRALFSVGFAMHYEPAGISTGAGRSLDTLGLQLTGSIAIMAYNRTRLAFGPEFAFATNITPGPAITSATQLLPGLALWYAPFQAPLLIGTALQLAIKFAKGSDPVIDTAYPGLRLRWGF